MVFDAEQMILNRKNNYRWGGMTFRQDANDIGGIVEYLERKNGEVTSADFLDVSRDKNSPSHDMFDWYDKSAAEKHRLETARKIINSLKVVVSVDDENDEEDEKIVSAFVRVNDGDIVSKASYVNIKDALEDNNSRKIVLDRMYRDMISFSQRYALYSEAANVIAAINEALKER